MAEKIVVITGGNSGIGKYTAEAFVRKSCTVYDLSRRDIKKQMYNPYHYRCYR